ncbi:MAG TPA: hypothetical protein VLJ68_13285 [Chitinophagaceae bacterium]|nr:hypothetical protein [Chitinophagaceae bacterium]
MKWQTVSTSPAQETYELWSGDKKLLTLDFHPGTSSARVQHPAEKRVFMIRKEGFRKNKTVLCNEYGVRLGQLLHDGKEDLIRLGNDRFNYIVRNNPKPEIVIYNESAERPLVTCGLNIDSYMNPAKLTKEKNQPANAQSSLLLALC